MFAHARAGETVSQMAGLGQAAGKPWACRLCRVLSIIVERDHCAKALSPDAATAGNAAIKAGIALWLVAVIASVGCWAFWAAVIALAGLL